MMLISISITSKLKCSKENKKMENNPDPNQVPQQVPPSTPPQSIQPLQMQPASPPVSFSAPISQPKKSLLWLWITLGVGLLLVVVLIVTILVAKGNADNVASNYGTSAYGYLGDLYDEANSPASDISQQVKAIDDIDEPILRSAFLGGVSGNYGKATKLAVSVKNKGADFKDKAKLYQNVYNLRSEYTKSTDDFRSLYAQLSGASDSQFVSTLQKMESNLNSLSKLFEDAQVPKDLESTTNELATVYKKMGTAFGEMATAYQARDKASYLAAYQSLAGPTSSESTQLSVLNSYYNDLSVKLRDSAKPLRELQDTVRTAGLISGDTDGLAKNKETNPDKAQATVGANTSNLSVIPSHGTAGNVDIQSKL